LLKYSYMWLCCPGSHLKNNRNNNPSLIFQGQRWIEI
jgi:hypothetical protein